MAEETKRLIAPLGGGWNLDPGLKAKLQGWERENALAFPAVYRSFLERFNGGYPYPSLFDIAIPPERWHLSDRTTSCEPLYSFELGQSHWLKQTYGPATPLNMWFIGADAFGLELLMSLRPVDHGAVYAWFDRSGTAFGGPENNEAHLFLQAGSFEEFIANLYDTSFKDDYIHWATPQNKLLAQELSL